MLLVVCQLSRDVMGCKDSKCRWCVSIRLLSQFIHVYYILNVLKAVILKVIFLCVTFRYFTNQELRDLFTLDDPYTSTTQMQLEQMHAHHRKTDAELDKHIEFIHTLSKF